jgi:hypothetical protein
MCITSNVRWKPDQEKPEMPFAESLAQHSACHLRIPVIERAEESEQNSANDYVMKVRHDEIRKAELPIEGTAACIMPVRPAIKN